MAERPSGAVLVVDDDPRVLELVASSLERFDVGEVVRAGGGPEAREALRRRDFDVVVTDLKMPDLDGLELMRWGREQHPGPLWIVLSGLQAFGTAVEALQCGAFDFVSKPPRIDQLVLSVRNALERRGLERERDQLLADLRQSSLELVDQVNALEQQSARIRQDLERAQTIQRALLPSVPPTSDRVRFDALYRPSRDLGGDLYDVVPLGDDVYGLYVADATGHGVAAAMLSVLFKARLRLVDDDGAPLPPAEVLGRVGRGMAAAVDSRGLFLTAAYALIDLGRGVVRIASAGHPPVYYRRADGLAQMLERTGPALGLERDARYGEHRLQVSEGDRLLLFTDGLIEALPAPPTDDPDPGYALLRGFLSNALTEETESSGAIHLQSLYGGSLARFRTLGRAEARDDVTLLLVEFRAGASSFDNRADGPEEEGGRAAVSVPADEAVVWVGPGEGELHLAVRGRGTWTAADGLHRLATSALAAGRDLTIDLSDCDYLDSTFLGTIHELVVEAPPAVGVRLVGARGDLTGLFDELGMDRVLAVVEPDAPLPELTLTPVRGGGAVASRGSQERLLRAHELLCDLSDENRERFGPLVAALRAELGPSD